MFKNGLTSVVDAESLGQLSTSNIDEKREEARAIILAEKKLRYN
jgi:hypothetical protein